MMRSKIDNLYGEMRSVEDAMEGQAPDLDAPAVMARIDQLEQRAIHLRLPTSYDSSLYTVKSTSVFSVRILGLFWRTRPLAARTTSNPPPPEVGVLPRPA